MKRLFFCVSILIFAGLFIWQFGTEVSSQSGRAMKPANSALANLPASNSMANTGFRSAYKYYLDIDRPSAGHLSPDIWRQIATTLQKAGIPTMFGTREILEYGVSWVPARIKSTAYDEGGLIIGPFTSPTQAMNVLYRLPRVLPKKYDSGFNGVQPGPTETTETWQVGAYQIWGFKSNFPIETQKPTIIHKSGVLDATVIEMHEGASGYGITVESDGTKYYIYMMGNLGGVKTIIGDCDTVGNRVRVWYKSRTPGNDDYHSLDVTKIQQIKKR